MSDYSRRWALLWRAWYAAAVAVLWLAGGPLNPFVASAAGTKGEQAAAAALPLMGTPYVYGGASTTGFDCSGLIQYIGNSLGVSLPRTAADQAGVAVPLADNPWQGQLPIGALLFLADPNVGPGITHVSLYLGGGQAADCYNEPSGCIVHSVTSSSYYQQYWVYANYPWGDTPAYGSGPNVLSDTSPVNVGQGVSAIGAAITQPGPLAQAAATPIAAMGQIAGQTVGRGFTAIDPLDPQDLAEQHFAGVGTVIGYVALVDQLVPLKVVPLLAVVLILVLIKMAYAGVRAIVSFIPS